MLALMGRALQLDPTIIRDEVIEMLGEYELLRLALVQQRARANIKSSSTNPSRS